MIAEVCVKSNRNYIAIDSTLWNTWEMGQWQLSFVRMALCKWILCRFCWFSPTWGCCGMSPAVSTIAESPRNERIGPSTLICAAVRLHRRSDGDSTTRQRWSMSGRNPGFNRILKEIHQNGLSHYALRQTTKFGCVKLCTYLLRAAAKLSKSLANLECLIGF